MSDPQETFKWSIVRYGILKGIGVAAAVTISLGVITQPGAAFGKIGAVAGWVNQIAAPPTPTPAPSPTPALNIPVRIIAVDPHCGANNFLDITFAAAIPPTGYELWPFAQAIENTHWYPAAQPIWNGDRLYKAQLYVSEMHDHRIAIFVLNTEMAKNVRAYLTAREIDKNWGLGIAPWENMIARDPQTVQVNCIVSTAK